MKILCRIAEIAFFAAACALSLVVAALLIVGIAGVGLGVGLWAAFDFVEEQFHGR